MSKRPLGAQISHALKARGVTTVFGIPGVHNIELYRGIQEAGLTHVLARHEQGAGFMADGYARATGKPGVAYVITGPGVTNAMTAMGQAYSDSVPMIVLSSCLERPDLGIGRGRLHEMKDQEGAAATVTDWSRTAMDAATAYRLLDRAFTECALDRPRPRHIQVPIDVLGGPADPAPPPPPVPPAARHMPGVVADVAARFARAKTPLFVFGGGACRAWRAARSVLAASKAASFTTYAGRGIAAPDDPLHFGSYLARPDSAAVISQADLVIAVGTELSEVDLWRNDLGHTAPMVRIDIDAQVFCDDQRCDLPVLADAATFLEALLPGLPARSASAWTAAAVAETRARWRAETDAERPGIVPVCDALAEVMPADAMIYSDMTQFAYVAKEVWPMARPGHWHHPYGFGTLGYALPAAIGGAVGRPGLPTCAIIGDYGLHYTLPELGVAVELGLPMPILLWDNGKLKEIEDCMISGQIAPNAVVARNPDFAMLARAFGAAADEPRDLDALQAALSRAFKAQGPTLIRMTPALTAG